MAGVQDNPAPPMAGETASPSPGLPDEGIAHLVREVRGLAHDYLALAALEARLSVNTLLRMVILAIVTAVLGLIGLGLAPALAMLVPAVASFVMALAGWRRIRHEGLSLGWPALQRAIRLAAAGASEEAAT